MVVTILAFLFVAICLLLVGAVLIQEPKGGGLAGVLGGSGASPFGAKTADVVMWATFALGLLFFVSTLALGFRLRSTGAVATSIQEDVPASTAPATTSAPASTGGATGAPASAPVENPAPASPAGAGQAAAPAGSAPSGQPGQ